MTFFKSSKLFATFALVGLSSFSQISAADTTDTVQGYNYSSKAIRVGDRIGGNTVNTKPEIVHLKVKPNKSSYRVNERMSFLVEGKKDYYLYVFNIDAKSGQSTQLIPNVNTKDHHLQAYKRYNIPGTVDFYADAPGTERLVFIGSTKPLPLQQRSMKSLGEFSESSVNDIAEVVESLSPNSAEVFKSGYNQNAIRIGTAPGNPNGSAVKNKPTVVSVSIY